MRIRNRLVALLFGVLALGGLVAMVPGGAAAGGRQEEPTAAGKPTPSPKCAQAKQLASAHLKVVDKYLSGDQKAAYKAALDRLVAAACNGTVTCELIQSVVAELRSIRGTLLPPRLELQLRLLEDALVQLVCSS